MDTLEILVDGLFDYAGMYPPASLSFQAALEQAARHPQDLKRPRLVATDMVLRQGLLASLTNEAFEAAGWPAGATCGIAVVGVPLEDGEATLRKLHAYNEAHADGAVPCRVDAVELVLEDTLVGDERAAQDAMAGVEQARAEIRVFVEPRWDSTIWRTGAARLFRLLGAGTDRNVGLKVRCAGPSAVTPQTMADIVAWAAANRAPLKATQGLHHPVVEGRWGNEWAFLGVTLALRLRSALGKDLPPEAMLAMFVESDARAFRFDGGHAGWRDHAVDAQALQRAKRDVPFSIGSCSIREPDADLERLF